MWVWVLVWVPTLFGKLTKLLRLSEKSSFGKFDSLPDPFRKIALLMSDMIILLLLLLCLICLFFLGYCDVVLTSRWLYHQR